MRLDRRKFLASALAGSAMAGLPGTLTAHAADTGGYKALVCVFLFGGLDGHDLILPYDQPSYDSFAGIRQTLLNGYGGGRSRENLLPLNPDNASSFGSRQFALPPEMPFIKALFDEGRVAVIGNVGPLIEPVTAATVEGGVKLPPRLFSHNDQQSVWQASAPEGAQLGWGGLFADAVLASGANSGGAAFTTLATAGVGPFLTGRIASPYQVSLSGSAGITAIESFEALGFSSFLEAAKNRFRADGFTGSNILARDMAQKFRSGIDANTAFDAARVGAAGFSTAFPESSLGSQLKAVAETMSIRGALSAHRQIFFVGTGGFDSHSGQADTVPGLLSQIDGAFSAFDGALKELGLSDQVTTFTASDFGRTLAVNGDGTDHGWGGHHLVMGGAVRGRKILGDIPEPLFGHDQDAGGGRLIPTLAVEQFADPLGRWWGLTSDEIAAALPNRANFDPVSLDLFI
ncbi:DUF1501 domain-containing protein [Parvularcula maris]|uniref:DUF1501 domain-containing protein n=1 Tax=Parvularcula maris TaxID=2965077 RepID=A0A9X2LAF7_9PROT|nr:DUF1501 domain-containing protein [Parvularcula maris]MCQ8185874.1 DUF1501 domain-containing protein [Parvularcula maris]